MNCDLQKKRHKVNNFHIFTDRFKLNLNVFYLTQRITVELSYNEERNPVKNVRYITCIDSNLHLPAIYTTEDMHFRPIFITFKAHYIFFNDPIIIFHNL